MLVHVYQQTIKPFPNDAFVWDKFWKHFTRFPLSDALATNWIFVNNKDHKREYSCEIILKLVNWFRRSCLYENSNRLTEGQMLMPDSEYYVVWFVDIFVQLPDHISHHSGELKSAGWNKQLKALIDHNKACYNNQRSCNNIHGYLLVVPVSAPSWLVGRVIVLSKL